MRLQILLSAYKSLESNKPTQNQESKAEFLDIFLQICSQLQKFHIQNKES